MNIMPIKVIIGLNGTSFNPFKLLIIRTNALITKVIAPAAAINLSVSIKDRTTIDAAIIAMAAAIAVIVPLTFCALFSPLIIIVIMRLSRPTAVIPLAKLGISTNPKREHTPAKTAIAIDIAIIVPATFAIFCSLLIVRILINNLTK